MQVGEKSLGLKQAQKVWFKRLKGDLVSIELIAIRFCEYLFVIGIDGKVAYLLVYVDDMPHYEQVYKSAKLVEAKVERSI